MIEDSPYRGFLRFFLNFIFHRCREERAWNIEEGEFPEIHGDIFSNKSGILAPRRRRSNSFGKSPEDILDNTPRST
jgi:hypothetical protein